MQQWFKLSAPAMKEVLYDVPAFRDFAGLSHWDEPIPSDAGTWSCARACAGLWTKINLCRR
uniref:hypothetical protein n=1 Tax=Simplicispira metamorpha TaxID=80881 RepID=UPI000E5C39A3|nr:hypothetical protein [Simplicispira metamorpha]